MIDKKERCILYGASGHAKVIIDSLIQKGINDFILYDDNPDIKKLMSFIVYNNYNYTDFPNNKLIVSIGDNHTRKKIASKILHPFGKLIHPVSYVSDLAIIEEGTVVFAHATIQPATIIGKHCIINTKASVDHDCIIDNFVHIAPSATICGGVSVGDGAFVGAGAVVLPNIKIGNWTVIGAGAVVTKDVPDFEIWVGNPAHKIKVNHYED
jgi:acetyltransferase EpsM